MNLESGYLTAMRAEYQRLTGALPGEDSDIGIRMALLANQLELLEEELGALRQAADPETAEGEMLDRHADCRGLRRKEAAAAGGVLRFYREGLGKAGWDRYRTINVKYAGQVVCTEW